MLNQRSLVEREYCVLTIKMIGVHDAIQRGLYKQKGRPGDGKPNVWTGAYEPYRVKMGAEIPRERFGLFMKTWKIR